MKRASATLLLLLASFGIALSSSAQLGGFESLSLTLSPEYPRPYQSVTVIPQSSSIDLAASSVRATVNGVVVSQGSGAEPIYVTLGGPGSVTTVSVTATYQGQTYQKTLTIRPADVALVIEPVSTSHPFYKGGALVSAEGRLRIIALPDLRSGNGAVIPADQLVYTWRNGEQVLQAASGIGKSTLTATAPVRYRDARISVTVTSQDRSVVGEATTTIAPADPLVRVYRNDPLLGPRFGTALPRRVTLDGTEETFRAIPYYFAEKPLITWQVNSVPSDNDPDITVRTTGAGSGRALLGVAARADGAPQSAATSFEVDFSAGDRGFDFFGL